MNITVSTNVPIQMTIFDLPEFKGKGKFENIMNLAEPFLKNSYISDKKSFLKSIEDKYNRIEYNRIRSALEFAEKVHNEQLRETGEPYMAHPLAVAKHIMELGFNPDTIITALLHDVIEDGEITYEKLKKTFGKNVAKNVVILTKPKLLGEEWIFAENPKYTFISDEYNNLGSEEKIRKYDERNNIYYPRIYESGSFIPFFVKICDNINNVESCEVFHEKKQLRTLRITATYNLLHMTKLLGVNNEKLKKIIELLEKKIPDFKLEKYVGKIKHSKPIIKLPPRIDKSRETFLKMPFPEMENISLYGNAKTAYLMGFLEVGFPKKNINYVELLKQKLGFIVDINNIYEGKSELPSQVGASEKIVVIKLAPPKIEFKKRKIHLLETNLKFDKLENIDIVEEDLEYKHIKLIYDELVKSLNEVHKIVKNTN